MITPFGFSGGGLIAVLDSIKKIGKALDDQDAASAECRRLTQNLHALQLIFHCLETLESSDANQSCMNAVQAEADKSLKLLTQILQNVAQSEKHLSPRGRKILESPFRVTKELSRLQADINMEIQKMNSSTANGLEQLM
jgi:vacuolar-type H+-ATPase catalytic subunit A/Vma1